MELFVSDWCSSLYLANSAGETESFKSSSANLKSFIVTSNSPLHSSSVNPVDTQAHKTYTATHIVL